MSYSRVVLERECASSVRDLCGCASLAGGLIGCGLAVMSPVIACCIAPRIGRDKELGSLEEYNKYLTGVLGGKRAPQIY